MRFSDFRKVRFKGWTEKTRVCHIFSQSYAYWKAYIKFMVQGRMLLQIQSEARSRLSRNQ